MGKVTAAAALLPCSNNKQQLCISILLQIACKLFFTDRFSWAENILDMKVRNIVLK
jgi:hypothetical protein